MLESVDRFLLEQRSLVNKSRASLFPMILQRQQLADYMARLGPERQAKSMPTIQEYLAEKSWAKGKA